MSNKKFIAECTTYDFKQALERRKVKSWLKSVSAFANTEGGSLFFGVADDGSVIGLDDVQSDAEFISEIIKTRIDPIPDMVLTPFEREGKHLLEVAIKPGQTIGIFIGPEGGFDPSEVELVQEGAHLISLGNRILRTETAGLAALSMLIYQLEK